MKIGYARVSTKDQNLDRQIAALRDAKCDQIFREEASGKNVEGRPQLEKAIDTLGTDDTFIVAEWDRATRSMIDGINIIQRIADRGAKVKVLDKPYLDLTTPVGQGILAFLSAMAQDERERIKRRSAEGRSIARARGANLGRKRILSEYQIEEALGRLEAGDSCRSIARSMGVSHQTISRLRA